MNQPAYKSFGQQARHYYTKRPHEGVPREPITSQAAWHGPELAATPERWRHELSDEDVTEISTAISLLRQQRLPIEEVDTTSFPLPGLATKIEKWRTQLIQGTGVVYVTGLPVANMSPEDIELAFWGIGHHLGTPGAQNPQKELLGHVKDYGESADDPFVRLYRTASNIRYHCDASDIVGLLCLQPARSGGQSRIVSTVTLYNELLAAHPELVSRMFEPFRMDLRGETKPGEDPYSLITPSQYANGQLRTFYHSDYFRSVERHQGISLTEEERTIIDFYDQKGLDPEIYLDMWLSKGDMQFVCNHTIAHSRTEYEDFDAPELKRHLLRLWLSVEQP